jgi:DNA-binding HxlR family transcriptional regulator
LSKSVQIDQEVLDSCKVIHASWNELTKVWTLPVIHALGLHEPARFNELKRRIEGISATSLAERLSELEKYGVVARRVFPESPPRVEYTLTAKGLELKDILRELGEWAIRWSTQPNKPQ